MTPHEARQVLAYERTRRAERCLALLAPILEAHGCQLVGTPLPAGNGLFHVRITVEAFDWEPPAEDGTNDPIAARVE